MEKKFNAPIFLDFATINIPEFREVKSADWIYYGEDNLYPDYVIELCQKSAKHQAIISGKVNYITGAGYKEGQNTWIKKVNGYETLKDITTKLSYDLELFNGFAIEVIYGLNGKIVEMYHIDFSRIRTNKDESVYFYSENWTVKNQEDNLEKTNFKQYVPFNFNKPKGKQLYVYTIKTPRKTGEPNVYPMPEYIGAVAAIETDIEISNFHLTNIKTGFSAGTILNLFNGTPTDEEAKKLERKFKEKFTGTDRAGSFMMNFAVDKEHSADVVHLQPSDLDKQYQQLAERVDQEIYTGHKVTSPILFGVSTPGALGQRNEMIDAYELFNSTYIESRQLIFEDTFNKIAGLNGMPQDIDLISKKPLNIPIPEAKLLEAISTDEAREFMGLPKLETPQESATDLVLKSINTLSPLVANNVLSSMTQNEIRALASLPPIPGGDIPKPLSPTQMSSQRNDDAIVQCFSECGVDKSSFDVVKKKRVKFTKEVDVFKSEIEAIQKFRVYSPLELKILSLLEKDNLMPAEEIAKALDIEVKQTNQVIDRLVKDKIITRNTDVIEGSDIEVNKPTAKGTSIIEDQPSDIITFKVMYDYDWRDEVPTDERDTADHPSRDFCKRIMKLNRLYSRADIENISNKVGYNAWLHQGGFWNNDGTIEPHCRHEWNQVIVTKK